MVASASELSKAPSNLNQSQAAWLLEQEAVPGAGGGSSSRTHFVVVQSPSCVQLFASLWTGAHQPSLSFNIYQSFLKLMSIESVMPSNHLMLDGDAIQPSPPAFNLSQHQGLFKWVSSSHQVDKVLEFQLQHQSFQWIFRTDFFEDGLVGSSCSPRYTSESSPTPELKSINSSALSFLYSPTLTSVRDYCSL